MRARCGWKLVHAGGRRGGCGHVAVVGGVGVVACVGACVARVVVDIFAEFLEDLKGAEEQTHVAALALQRDRRHGQEAPQLVVALLVQVVESELALTTLSCCCTATVRRRD